MNYDETLEYIHSVSWRGSKPGLERITALMNMLGNPQDRLKFIHVAGTNGKGSFCAMTEAVLRAAGYKTGLFTSPFVYSFRERMQYCGEEISCAELSAVTEEVRVYADSMQDKPTEFELITAIGLVWFARKKCDIVVLECGMGGLLDSTNVISTTLLSVITGVALDHMAILGATVELIAAEKAGIIKRGVPVLFGGDNQSALGVIRSRAGELNAPLALTDDSAITVHSRSINGSCISYKNEINLNISLAGSYQPHNAATVIEAVYILRGRGMNIPDSALAHGLASTVWHARFELLNRNPDIVFDGGHNPQGAAAIAESVKDCLGGSCVLISGIMADKSHLEVASILSDVAVRVYCVSPDNPRALDAETWADEFRIYGIPSTACESIADAVAHAITYAKEHSLPVVGAGSLYMYKEFRDSVEEYLHNA